MTLAAFVLIKVDTGAERNVYDEILAIEQTELVHELFGEWDMIALINLSSPEELDHFMTEVVRKIEGVNLTSTMIVAR